MGAQACCAPGGIAALRIARSGELFGLYALGELLFELGDLSVCQRVFDGDGDLVGDAREQFRVLLGEGVFTSTRDVECAQCTVVYNERYDAPRPDPIIVRVFELRGRELLEIKTPYNDGSSGSEGQPFGTSFQRKYLRLRKVALVLQVKAVQSQLSGLLIVKGDRSGVVRDELAERIGGRTQQAPKIQAGDHGIVDFEQQLIARARLRRRQGGFRSADQRQWPSKTGGGRAWGNYLFNF
jgi:hypothetical protein